MSDPTATALLLSLLLMGFGGSLHCTAMCGPILLTFQQALANRDGTGPGLGLLLYHGGRIWTYALLGFLAGLSGQAALSWQRPLTCLAATVLITGGTFTLWQPFRGRFVLGSPIGCLAGAKDTWLAPLLRSPNPLYRLALGALMGLLPCGLVYTALLMAFALGTPLLSGFGMLLFGLGTTPSLTLVLLGGRWLGRALAGPRLTGGLLILGGLLMLGRALLPRHLHLH